MRQSYCQNKEKIQSCKISCFSIHVSQRITSVFRLLVSPHPRTQFPVFFPRFLYPVSQLLNHGFLMLSNRDRMLLAIYLSARPHIITWLFWQHLKFGIPTRWILTRTNAISKSEKFKFQSSCGHFCLVVFRKALFHPKFLSCPLLILTQIHTL